MGQGWEDVANSNAAMHINFEPWTYRLGEELPTCYIWSVNKYLVCEHTIHLIVTWPQTTNCSHQQNGLTLGEIPFLALSKKPQGLHSKVHSMQLCFPPLLLVVLFFNRNTILPLLSKESLSLNQVTKPTVSLTVLLLEMLTLLFSKIMKITYTIKILSNYSRWKL